MRRIPPITVLALVSLLLGGAVLARASVVHEPTVDYAFSHQGLTPVPDCQDTGQTNAQPVAENSLDARSTPLAAPSVLPELDLRLEAISRNSGAATGGLPDPLRLFTIHLPTDDGAGGDRREERCRVGYLLLYVVSGTIELTHHLAQVEGTPDVTGAELNLAGAVSFMHRGDAGATPLDAGNAVTLQPGDGVFMEQAIFSLRQVGEAEVLIVGSSVTPEWLPCRGGGCG